jgi:DNA-directed RNA polymerase specialized sigma24 family protein
MAPRDDDSPYWRRATVELRAMLQGDLRRRIPALKSRHEDLVQETLADLSDRIAEGGEGVPSSWLAIETPSDEDRAHLARLARTILRRRVADLFRARVRGRADEPVEAEPEAILSRERDADRAAHTAELLRITALAMEALSANDREALLLAAERDGERVEGRMPDKDRQRLSRARSRLLAILRERLGDSPLVDLLETE